MPGGFYRAAYDYPNKKKVMDTIDILLKEPEFSSIDIKRIVELHNACSDAVEKSFDHDLPEDERMEWERKYKEIAKLSREAEEELMPIFIRLIEMGFKAGDLTR